jgi:tripartite ATP-independent transporter DctM subunit
MILGICVTLFFVLLFVGAPVAFVLALSSLTYLLLKGEDLYLVAEQLFNGMNAFVLMAIPFFILAGEIMNKAGISERLIEFSNLIVGRVRGGLAQVNVMASILFAGITGVALGEIAALGRVFIPNMEKQGYDRPFAAAVTATASLIGPIIPPSTIIVIYAAAMNVSIGTMFVAAIVPGLLMGLTDMAVVKILAERRQYPKCDVPVSAQLLLSRLKDALLALVMPALIVGGILGGLFTPTEAAAVSVAYAVIIGTLVFGTLNLRQLPEILGNTAYDSSKLFLIIAGAALISWIFGVENVPVMVVHGFKSFSENPYVLIFMINLFFLIMGMWLDPAVMIILFAPTIAPLAYEVGIHPIQFGIMMIVNANLGFCTPPVGNVLFAVCDVAKIGMAALSRAILPFLIGNALLVLALGYVPALSLTLPRLFGLID